MNKSKSKSKPKSGSKAVIPGYPDAVPMGKSKAPSKPVNKAPMKKASARGR